jgi:hypothetical protein
VEWLVLKAMFLRLNRPWKEQSRRNSYGPSVVIRERGEVVSGVCVVCGKAVLTDGVVLVAR